MTIIHYFESERAVTKLNVGKLLGNQGAMAFNIDGRLGITAAVATSVVTTILRSQELNIKVPANNIRPAENVYFIT
jgi:hypothetical protein